MADRLAEMEVMTLSNTLAAVDANGLVDTQLKGFQSKHTFQHIFEGGG